MSKMLKSNFMFGRNAVNVSGYVYLGIYPIRVVYDVFSREAGNFDISHQLLQ